MKGRLVYAPETDNGTHICNPNSAHDEVRHLKLGALYVCECSRVWELQGPHDGSKEDSYWRTVFGRKARRAWKAWKSGENIDV